MPIAANPENYTLGRGVVYFDKEVSGAYEGERDMGNAPAFAVSLAVEKLDHYSSRSGLRAKDKIVVTEVTPTMTFTLDEINVDNVALMFMAETTAVTQVAADDLSVVLATAVTGNRFFSLGDYKDVGIWTLAYDSGVGGAPTIAEVVSGATGVGTVIGFNGDAVSGVLFIEVTTPGFIDAENITGDGTFDADAVGTETFDTTQLSVHDTATPTTMYAVDTDYTVDSATGRIFIVAGGGIETAGLSITVYFGVAAASYTTINAFEETSIEGRVRFVPDNPVGNNMELLFWRVDLTPAGEVGMIADEWQVLEFTGEILKDETNHPTSPYGRIITDDTIA